MGRRIASMPISPTELYDLMRNPTSELTAAAGRRAGTGATGVNLDGSAVLHADPERVWSVITDPAVLARTIPGCESLEQVGRRRVQDERAVGVGAIRGTYAGEVQLSDQQRPSSYVMHASGAGGAGQRAGDGDDQPGAGTTTGRDADLLGGRRGRRPGGRRGPADDHRRRQADGRPVLQGDRRRADRASSRRSPPRRRRSAAGDGCRGRSCCRGPAGLRRQGGCRGRRGAGDAQTLLLGAGVGALLTLLGVLVGYRLGRRNVSRTWRRRRPPSDSADPGTNRPRADVEQDVGPGRRCASVRHRRVRRIMG